MLFLRARATNTQLGQEETSPYTRLDVLSGGNDGIDVAPEIVVPPDESVTLTRGDSVTELKCIANAKPLHELETVWLKVGDPSNIQPANLPSEINDDE